MKQNKIPRNEYIRKPVGKTNPYKEDTIYTDMGQWKYPGQVTKIPSGDITMQGVPYPVYGQDNLGYSQMMYPGMDYQFPGQYVTEIPMAQDGWESRINNYLGNPLGRAQQMSTSNGKENDALRHAYASMYSSENAGPFIANALGLGHEIMGQPNSMKEHAGDIYNNFVGSMVGALPFVSTSNKEKAIKKLHELGLLSSGTKAYGGDPSLPNITGHYQKGGGLTYEQWKKKYKLVESPDYNLKRAWELGYTPDAKGHLPTVDEETGVFLKTRNHPTLRKELDWYNSPAGEDFRNQNDIDSSGTYFKYIPKNKYILKTGGWLDQYQTKGEVKPYKAKSQEDYDYRKKMYNDSLALHNYSDFQAANELDQKSVLDHIVDIGFGFLPVHKGERDYSQRVFNYAKNLVKNNPRIKIGLPGVGQKLYTEEDYKKEGSTDVYHDTIKPASLWMGDAVNAFYKKPVQQILPYTEEAIIKPSMTKDKSGRPVGVIGQTSKNKDRHLMTGKDWQDVNSNDYGAEEAKIRSADPEKFDIYRLPNNKFELVPKFKKLEKVVKKEPEVVIPKVVAPEIKIVEPKKYSKRSWEFTPDSKVLIYKDAGGKEIGRETYSYDNKLMGKKGELFEPDGNKDVVSKKMGGWLDAYDDEYRRGGQRRRRGTSKNIQSSINDIFRRNYDVFGPASKSRFNPRARYEEGGYLKHYQGDVEGSQVMPDEAVPGVNYFSLPEVTVKPKTWLQKVQESDFIKQIVDRLDKSTGGKDWYKDPSKGIGSALAEVVSLPFAAPQLAATYGLTGKVQTPSEAMNIQNPYAAFITDAVLDPTNLVGAGLADDALKLSSKAGNLFKKSAKLIDTPKQLVKKNKNKLNGSFIKELIGEIKQGKANKASIKKGNEWLENWIKHPATQAKIDKDIEKEMALSKYYAKPEEQRALLETMRNQAKNFKPNTKEYPLTEQFLEALLGWDPIHNSNWGVSYMHGYPTDYRQKVLTGVYKKLPDKYGSWVSRSPLIDQERRFSTTIHEGTHDWVPEDVFKQLKLRNMSLANTNPKIKEDFLNWENLRAQGANPVDHMNRARAYQAYLADPTEMHARTMELRQELGLKPDDVVTPEYADQVIKWIDEGNSKVDPKFLKVIDKDPNKFAEMFNRFWGTVPATIGAGYALQEQKMGGWLDKAQDGKEYSDAEANYLNRKAYEESLAQARKDYVNDFVKQGTQDALLNSPFNFIAGITPVGAGIFAGQSALSSGQNLANKEYFDAGLDALFAAPLLKGTKKIVSPAIKKAGKLAFKGYKAGGWLDKYNNF